jgi:hypothetical protein
MQGIDARCSNGHVQQIVLSGYTREHAQQLAALMDGTSELYFYKPREHPVEGSKIGRCDICDGWVECSLFGYEDILSVDE